MATPPSLDQLRTQVQRMESRGREIAFESATIFSTGGAVLDRMLPHGGLRRGTVVQWTSAEPNGSGAVALAFLAAAEVLRTESSGGRPMVIFNWPNCIWPSTFYPPAAIALGVPADRMVVVTKGDQHHHTDFIWALDQALRCDAIAAVWAEIGGWLDDRDARRLQLSAEAGGTIGLFVRPAAVRGRPSFADINWHVANGSMLTGANRSLQVTVDRCRGGNEGASAWIEIDSQLAIPGQPPADRIVASSAPPRPQHATKMVSDLACRLATPKIAKRNAS